VARVGFRALRRRLGAWGADESPVEDLALRFWEELWIYRATYLPLYDPGRGLAAYLNHLTRWQVQFWRRQCGRQQKRGKEGPLPPHGLAAAAAPGYPEGLFRDELAGRLTAQERRYFAHLCGEATSDPACQFSDTNRWKLHERLLRKSRSLLGC
jgi:hypothetical protein